MKKKKSIKSIAALAAGTIALGASADAANANLFECNYLGSGAELRSELLQKNNPIFVDNNLISDRSIEATCSDHNHGKGEKGKEGKCGEKGKEGKCGEGKCGEKGKEGKCGEKGKEGKCGEKGKEGKCGEKGKEGKCGEKGKEGKCGEKGKEGKGGEKPKK